jgi:GT2 family glycosyltransferase
MRIGLGLTTHNRPEYAEKCIKSIGKHLGGCIDMLYVVNDGSDSRHNGAYDRARQAFDKTPGARSWMALSENVGVARAKNFLLNAMLDDKCDLLFLIEDDILVLAPEAITRYVRVANENVIHHLSFAHHGEANVTGSVKRDGELAFYPHSIGAFGLFTAEVLREVGLFDTNFHNAWEHVEHELRMIKAGYMPGAEAFCYPDVYGSWQWLKEIPGSLVKSSIRSRDDWQSGIVNGLRYWKTEKPETFAMLFGPGARLEQYAATLIGKND